MSPPTPPPRGSVPGQLTNPGMPPNWWPRSNLTRPSTIQNYQGGHWVAAKESKHLMTYRTSKIMLFCHKNCRMELCTQKS